MMLPSADSDEMFSRLDIILSCDRRPDRQTDRQISCHNAVCVM